MKKKLFLSIGIAFMLVSCSKKDIDCICTIGSTSETETYNKVTKRQAKDHCVSSTFNMGGGQSVTEKCELKK